MYDGLIIVKNSTFSDGKGYLIYAELSDILIQNVTMKDSSDILSHGHGVVC